MESFGAAVNGVSYTEDPFSGPLTFIAPWNYKVLAALMFVVTSVSLCENFTVMLVTFRFKQLRQPLNYIIVNLSVADFLVSLTGGTISFLTNFHGYFFLGKWACVLEGFAVTFFGIVALWSLAVLAFERFFVICRPLGNIRLRGKHAALGLLFVWTFSFIWTIPPVLGWSSYTVSKIGTTCEPNWYPRLAAVPAFFSKTAAVYNPIIYVFMNKQFRKCLVQLLSCSDVTVIEGNINQTTERAGMTNESNTGEMSAIAARIPAAGSIPPKTEEHPNERSSFTQIPIPENKVCPM
ncbi:vertebrate ancient opsin-like [Sinocyclocheilus grahami]|uniref:vertebrate ancient opsin-like n=1 Tax=Sinocyclocheilus grahami TaxID=75366 RepID=UPI0007ACE3FE|nr:PREDICTED: vertebrate ancient opsin-like [Sinocyclocheilus grahami]